MGLIGWWPLHENSGKAYDLSGKENHGSVNGPVQGIAAKGGLTGYHFDGTDDYVDLPSIADLDFAIEAYTVSAWINPDNSSSQTFASKHPGTHPVGFRLSHSNERINLRTTDSNGNGPSANGGYAPANTWTHVVGIVARDSREFIELYVNGEKVDRKSTASINDDTSNANGLLGDITTTAATPYSGSLADFRVYDHVLTPSEIRELYELGGKAAAPEDGVSRYKLDGDATDSWHSNDGTVNGTTFTSGYYNQAARFDGSSNIKTGITDNLQTGNFSVSAWMKIPSFASNGTRIVADDKNGNGWALSYGDAGENSIRFFVRGMDSTSLDATNTINSTNIWYHVVGVFDNDNNNRFIFINGKKEGAITSDSGTPTTDSGNIYLGASGSGNNLIGEIDDVRIYDRALKDWEVKAIYRGYNDLATPPGKEDPDAVSKYKFDDKISSGAVDSWGSNDGTITAGIYSNDAIRGKSMNFGGSDEYVDIGNFGFDSSTSFTWSLWAKPEDTNNAPVMGRYDGSDDLVQFYYVTDDRWIFRLGHVGGNDHNVAGGKPNVGSWDHIVGMYDPAGPTSQIYVNGELVDRQTGTIDDFATSNPIYIGGRGGSTSFFNGLIDDVRIYNRTLTPHEVQQLYQWGTRGRDMRNLTANSKSAGFGTVTKTYTTAQQHSVNVPDKASKATIKAWGGETRNSDFNFQIHGGYTKGTLDVSNIDSMEVFVGGEGGMPNGGFNGGGDGGSGDRHDGSGGAGASDVRTGGSSLSDRIIVAGGAGGESNSDGTAGGAGGPDTGASGKGDDAEPGTGGTQSSGGAGGSGSGAGNGSDGSLGTGGAGGDALNNGGEGTAGGGGGGGYYGGGGGGANGNNFYGAGGGGGSNYIDSTLTNTQSQRGVSANNNGDGKVVIIFKK
ncbi:MAG: hypothetical protein ACI9LV_000597 [Candidatus Nanohaloarchaea archaeon]|jgi:hypothetical protein